ncbi:MAG: restriction endonuclease [Steroidobacteraceae bacterium]
MAKGEGIFDSIRAAASKLPWQVRMAAVVSFVKRVRGIRSADAAIDDTPPVVRAMEWRNFELLICGALRREGYRIDERGGSGPNGEIDLIATKARQRLLIQCKHWKTQQVGVSVIRELNGVVAARRADGGIVVTGGTFTKEARDFARGCRIRLIGGESLQQIIAAAQLHPSAQLSPTIPVTPRCPKCGAGMVDYVARQGKFAGKHFWACSLYPKCTGIALALESEEQTRGSRSAA